MAKGIPLREQARKECRKAFGEPQVLKVRSGEIDRWTLTRPGGGDMYVTLDAPELPDLVHVMVSDPTSTTVDPICSVVMRTIEEVQKTIKIIQDQWNDPRARGAD